MVTRSKLLVAAFGVLLGAVSVAYAQIPNPLPVKTNETCVVNGGNGCGGGCESPCTVPVDSCCEVTPVKYDLCVGPVEGATCQPVANKICATVAVYRGTRCNGQACQFKDFPRPNATRTTTGC